MGDLVLVNFASFITHFYTIHYVMNICNTIHSVMNMFIPSKKELKYTKKTKVSFEVS